MPPRESELPEGTDHIIAGAMERGKDGPTASHGGSAVGFVAGGGGRRDDTGGTVTGNDGGNPMREGIANLKQQATDRVRQLADDGKTRASDALDEISRAVEEAADQIEGRVGSDYAAYARRAADAVSGLATTLREREVDELYQDAQDFVRKSPGVAIGVAAAVGFVLVRLIKAGIPEEQEAEDAGPTGAKRGRGRKRAGTDA